MEQQEGRSYSSFSTSTSPITLSLMVLVVTAIGLLSSFWSSSLFRLLMEEFSISTSILLHHLFILTPRFIIMIFVYLLLYKFTGDILRKEKKLNKVVYSFSRTLLSLWIFGVIGAACVRIMTFILYFDPELPIRYSLFLLLTDTYYIIVDPLVPVLVVFIRMAYEKTLSSQINIIDVTKTESISSSAFESPIPFSLILLTLISCMLLPILSTGSFLGNQLIYLSSGYTDTTIAIRLFSIVFSIFSLCFYFGLGIVTMNILKNEIGKNLRYGMQNSLLKLYIGGLLGAICYNWGISPFMWAIIYPESIFSFYSLLIGGLYSLRVPLIPVLIVLFLIADEGLFRLQTNYEQK